MGFGFGFFSSKSLEILSRKIIPDFVVVALGFELRASCLLTGVLPLEPCPPALFWYVCGYF
jgi:hypothetical protein